MRQLIAGNWKMHGFASSLDEIEAVRAALANGPSWADVLICPPATLIGRAVAVAGDVLPIGGQDCHEKDEGAFTGDISAGMLADAGARAVIVGHSERRRYHGESNRQVGAKASAAHRAGLLAIVCIGETEKEREDGSALSVCSTQIAESVPDSATAANTAIAYEPVWAIGTGRTPNQEQIREMHAHVQACLVRRLGSGASALRVLYGGSVNPKNAREILAIESVGGTLVGGASLRAADFLAILSSARRA